MDWMKLAEAKREQIIAQTSKLVSVNSIEDPSTADPAANAPFGAAVRQVLDYALDMGKASGFATKARRSLAFWPIWILFLPAKAGSPILSLL